MKNLKYFIAVLSLSNAFFVYANTEADSTIINKDITIQKEYVPVIHDAGKINSKPSVQTPEVKKAEVSYTNFSSPLQAGYEISTMPWAMLNPIRLHDSKEGYARIGFGNYWSTLADFAYPLIKQPSDRLDFNLNHYGTFSTEMYHTTQAALSYDHSFKKSALSIGGKFGLQGFNYYAATGLVPANTYVYNLLGNTTLGSNLIFNPATIITWDANIGYKSLPSVKGLRFALNSDYGYFNSSNGLTEHSINTTFNYNGEAGKSRIGVDFNLHNLFYVSNNFLATSSNYSVLSLDPYYSYINGMWDLRAGVKANFSFEHGKPFSPSPDLRAQAEIIKKAFYLYAGVTGNYQVNTLRTTTEINRYIDPNLRIADTYTPYDAFFGLKAKPFYNVLVDLFVDYRQIDNQYFFINKAYQEGTSTTIVQSNVFDVVYYNTQLVNIGLNASYNINDVVSILFKGKYNFWTVSDGNPATTDIAWNMPTWEFNLDTDVKATKNLLLSANAYVATDRVAQGLGGTTIPLKSIVDINLAGTYSFSSWLSAFLKVNNLIGSQYELYNAYPVHGFNVIAGAAFSF